MRHHSLAALAAMVLWATPAVSVEVVGQALAVNQSARASGQVGDRELSTGSSLVDGDRLRTGADGEVQVMFGDQTGIVIGPDGALTLESAGRGQKPGGNRFTVGIPGGSFRSISDTADQGVEIATGTARIQARDAAFDFTVLPTGGTLLVALRGKSTLCSKAGECKTVETACSLLRSEDGRTVEEVGVAEGRLQLIREHFPYLNSQAGLLEPFQVKHESCIQGGLANFALDQSTIQPRDALFIAGGVAALAAIIVVVTGGGGGGGSGFDSSNSTND